MAGKLIVVVGGQFGSEGKGSIVGYLARTEPKKVLVIRVGGPNAGHTVYDHGRRYAMRQVPVGFVNPRASLAIGPGSEIDENVLHNEVQNLEHAGFLIRDRLYIDPSATILEPSHIAQGEQQRRRGSTGKGVGVVRAERVRRRAETVRDQETIWPGILFPVQDLAAQWLRQGGTVIVEGTQGYGLGLHTPYYPFTTSGDCTAIDMLAQAQIPPWTAHNGLQVWVVLRTHPIRVAGDSGPLWDETSWEQLAGETDGHVEPEYTTVTQKERRVGRWDMALAQTAIQRNGGPPSVRVALTMFDYWHPLAAGAISWPEASLDMRERVDKLEQELGARIELVGTGPDTIIDRRP